MQRRFLYLDTFASVRVATDPALAVATRACLVREGFSLVVGVMNLMELVSWPKRWAELLSFVSSVPLCIAQNPEEIAATEVANYPSEITTLPVSFCSSDHTFSADELRDALSTHLEGKVTDFASRFRSLNQEIFQSILSNRISFPPERAGKYTSVQRQIFLQSSVLRMLFPSHRDFFGRLLAVGEEINIQRFKSAYLQALAIFIEYYVQKKPGKVSDVGDIHQLGLVPYVDLSVLDNERHNLIQRINREGLFPTSLRTCNLSEFKDILGTAQPNCSTGQPTHYRASSAG